MRNRFIILQLGAYATLAGLGLPLLTSCSEAPPAPPMCRYQTEALPQMNTDQVRCVIRIADSLITIKENTTNKLTVPGGKQLPEESFQCAAHRHTWEQTGFNVEVKSLLGQSKQGTAYFDCQLDGGFEGEILQFPVPKKARKHIKEINLEDPFLLSVHDWEKEESLISVRHYFNQVERKP